MFAALFFRQPVQIALQNAGGADDDAERLLVVDDDVEIGSCTTIDRARLGRTWIGEGTKIDNLVQIAHNCKIGKHNVFASQVGIAGSATTGNYVFMGGQSGVKDHIRLGDGAMIGAKSGVPKSITKEGETWFGYPSFPIHETLRIQAAMRSLPALLAEIRVLERRLRARIGG